MSAPINIRDGFPRFFRGSHLYPVQLWPYNSFTNQHRESNVDRGIWMTWYNLPQQGRDEYLQWLHGHYIPNMLKLPGYLWGAHYASENQREDDRRAPTASGIPPTLPYPQETVTSCCSAAGTRTSL